jgi:hypothetical protein
MIKIFPSQEQIIIFPIPIWICTCRCKCPQPDMYGVGYADGYAFTDFDKIPPI